MCDWQKGIGRLDPNATVNFTFRNGFSTYCDNLQLFKALGIYDQVEADVLRNYRDARIKYWGIPIDNEDHGYYYRSERPTVTVTSKVTTDDSSVGKTVVVKNEGIAPVYQKETVTTSKNKFEETIFNIATNLEFNQHTNIAVESQSSRATADFSATTSKQVIENYSVETETNFTISQGEQLVSVTNPTQITTFEVLVDGKFCINCDPRYDGHYLHMPYLFKYYKCQVITKDIGLTAWWVEQITGNPVNTQFKLIGGE